MTKRIFAAVLLLCLFVSVVYAQSAATVFGWPPADGSVTNAKLAEPVSVANGGTGATTAAAGLAALGGASLNGSSTVAFHASIYNTATGTAAAPTYSFSSDPDTGIYSPGAGTIGFGVNATDVVQINSGGVDLTRNFRFAWSTLDTFDYLGVTTAQNGMTYGPSVSDRVTLAGYYGLTLMAGSNLALTIPGNTRNVLIATSTDDGANKLQVNGPVKFQTSTGTQIFGQITLDDDESIDINTLFTGVAANCGIFKVFLASNDGYGDFYLQGPANGVTLISQRYAAKTDSDGNICVFSAGSGNYTLKNRLGASATFVFSYIGRK